MTVETQVETAISSFQRSETKVIEKILSKKEITNYFKLAEAKHTNEYINKYVGITSVELKTYLKQDVVDCLQSELDEISRVKKANPGPFAIIKKWARSRSKKK